MNANTIGGLIFLILIGVLMIITLRGGFRKVDPEEQRRKALATLASKLNLKFNPNSDIELAKKYSFLRWLRRGDLAYAYNIFNGDCSGFPVAVFDYTFVAGQYNYYWSAYVLKMRTTFPDVIISRENMKSRLAENLGESHITFESKEFSHKFRVHCADKKFAYDVCNAQMMEYLLANKDLTVEINGPAVAVLFEDWLRPERVEVNLSRLIEIRKLLPEYLFTNA